MKLPFKLYLYWTPRIFGILFCLFLSLFALDVINEENGFWNTILAFMIHLTPVYMVMIALVVAWRWEHMGAFLFITLGILYIIWAWGLFPLSTYLFISGPLFLIGTLFLVSWAYKKQDSSY